MVIGGARIIDIVADDPPQPGVVLANHPRCRGDRHVADQRHDVAFEQQREAAALARPRHAHFLDPARIATDTWHARVQIRRVLPEVQMPPGQRPRVVHPAPRLATARTVEPRVGRERNVDVQPLRLYVETGLRDKPRVLQPQCRLENIQFPFAHLTACPLKAA